MADRGSSVQNISRRFGPSLLVHHGSAMNQFLQSIAKAKTVKVAEHQPLPQVPQR